MSAENGGPAFPTFEEIDQWDKDAEKYREAMLPVGGMSLRDYFAAKAMAAMIATAATPCLLGLDEAEPHTAKAAYKMADVMLKERSKS